MRGKTLLLVGFVLAAALMGAAALFSEVLSPPWSAGGPAAEARTAVLSGGKFAPVAEPPGFHAPGGGSPLVNFQGTLTNPSTGLPVANGSYSITFRIFDAASGGNNLWSETQSVAVSGALLNVLLGSVTPLTASVFDGTARYLEVQVSPDLAMTPRLQFGYVPYAFQAEQAGALSRLGFSRTAVDSAGGVGAHSSITIGADGLPVISYYDDTNGDLKVAHCGNAACSAGNTVTTVESAGNVGTNSSVAIGADGLPVISYHDIGNGDLKVAHCGNAACSAGNTITTADSAGFVGEGSSATIGGDGLPVISYHDITNRDLKVAHCGNAACSAANTITTVDSAGDVGQSTSVTIGADGLPVISYEKLFFDGDLKVAHCGNAACTAGNTITTVDSAGDVGTSTSVTIGAQDLPVIAYVDDTNDDLKVARCGDAACSTPCGVGGTTCTTVDSAGIGNGLQSATIGADGLPVISYWDVTNQDLKVAHCGNAACNASNSLTTVDNGGDAGTYSSVTIGADGLPIISYYDSTNVDLKVAHCSNRYCIPFHRPR